MAVIFNTFFNVCCPAKGLMFPAGLAEPDRDGQLGATDQCAYAAGSKHVLPPAGAQWTQGRVGGVTFHLDVWMGLQRMRNGP